jgi:hypothetical protein
VTPIPLAAYYQPALAFEITQCPFAVGTTLIARSLVKLAARLQILEIRVSLPSPALNSVPVLKFPVPKSKRGSPESPIRILRHRGEKHLALSMLDTKSSSGGASVNGPRLTTRSYKRGPAFT